MSKPELLYFNAAGRAEAFRTLFHIGGVDFEDTRFSGKDWPSIKPTTPLGSVPVLKIDGLEYCQSVSLARYAAKLAGWYPEAPLDALKCDMIAESTNELTTKFPKSKDKEELKNLRQEFQKTTMTRYYSWIEGIIQANGGTYVAGKTPSYTDLLIKYAVAGIQAGFWDFIDTSFFDQFPGIIATCKAIDENEQVKAYIASKQ